jgi:hypothetical protein
MTRLRELPILYAGAAHYVGGASGVGFEMLGWQCAIEVTSLEASNDVREARSKTVRPRDDGGQLDEDSP